MFRCSPACRARKPLIDYHTTSPSQCWSEHLEVSIGGRANGLPALCCHLRSHNSGTTSRWAASAPGGRSQRPLWHALHQLSSLTCHTAFLASYSENLQRLPGRSRHNSGSARLHSCRCRCRPPHLRRPPRCCHLLLQHCQVVQPCWRGGAAPTTAPARPPRSTPFDFASARAMSSSVTQVAAGPAAREVLWRQQRPGPHR